MMTAGAPVREGSVLGRYELLLRVAQGGMACVWAARLHGTRGFRKLVAIKTILPGVMGEERLEHMFLEEASLAAGIDHPNVVDTIELGEHDGTLFMVLEWVDGEPLSTVILEAQQNGGIPLPIGVNLIAQACKGLHAAHELADQNGVPLGLVHRDVSPHNLLVTYSGLVKVLDFGIAKATQKASSLTEAGEIKGKLAFMAPEQVRGREVDRRTDVFALGTLLYVVTTGRHPWKGDNPGETAQRLVSERPVKPPSSFYEGYPESLEAVVLKALEKDPDKRYASAAELLTALDDALPTSLEGNAEARVAEYMQGLLGSRGMDRRKKIRLAGDMLDQNRDPTHAVITSSTSGSTSAVAFDKWASGSMPAQSSPLGPTITGSGPSVVVARRRLDRFVWLGALAVAVGVGVVVRGALERAPSDAPRAASSPVPHAELSAPPAPQPPSSTATATPAPAADRDVSAEDEGESRADSKRKARGTGRVSSGAEARRAAAALAVPVAPAASASNPSGAPEKAPAPRTSADAWNPQTFGNRY